MRLNRFEVALQLAAQKHCQYMLAYVKYEMISQTIQIDCQNEVYVLLFIIVFFFTQIENSRF